MARVREVQWVARGREEAREIDKLKEARERVPRGSGTCKLAWERDVGKESREKEVWTVVRDRKNRSVKAEPVFSAVALRDHSYNQTSKARDKGVNRRSTDAAITSRACNGVKALNNLGRSALEANTYSSCDKGVKVPNNHGRSRDEAGATSKKVIWADNAGFALCHSGSFNEASCSKGKALNGHQPVDTSETKASDAFQPIASSRLPRSPASKCAHQPGDLLRVEIPFKCKHQAGGSSLPEASLKATGLLPAISPKLTYKEALLSPPPPSLPSRGHSAKKPSSPSLSAPASFSFKGRCFRCLGRDHRASHCRDPVRCIKCFKFGHFARACIERLPLPVYRFFRARASYLSAFVPISDDFAARQNRRRNAILVDVLPHANLGHFPQDTIALELANRFGGYSNDFHVARYSERDYVVLLPE